MISDIYLIHFVISQRIVQAKQEDKLKHLKAWRKGQQLTLEVKVLIYSIIKEDKSKINNSMQNYWISGWTLINKYKELNNDEPHSSQHKKEFKGVLFN